MKIFHVITCLNDGGAEAVMYRAIVGLPQDEHFVVSLTGFGRYGSMLNNAGVEVVDLDMTTLTRKISAIFRLSSLIKSFAPDAIQTWMYHADFVGGLAARLARCRNVNWGLHNSMVSAKDNPIHRLLLIRLNAALSHVIPHKIISCSDVALRAHSKIGYDAQKLLFIPNGYPVDSFSPDDNARMRIRAELGVSDDETLLGMVARSDPQKDHLNLLDALKMLKSSKKFKFLLVGNGLDQSSKLRPEVVARGLDEDVIFAGQRSDISDVMNALDIHCLSSAFSEAFPNVLCEAMLSGTPCVTTDVGDSAFIVGDTGWVVPPRSPSELAQALFIATRSLPDKNRKIAARRRIVENFSIEKMTAAYRLVWREKLELRS